ncbi:MAG: hypothetical protein JWN04_2695 [Myxococcaceae bacterium]|nr:hypothetical protein [Myxococcaceae bacterium]
MERTRREPAPRHGTQACGGPTEALDSSPYEAEPCAALVPFAVVVSLVRVGFYFHPPRAWEWDAFLSGRLGLSGTDGQVLRAAHELSHRYGMEVVLLQSRSASPHERIQSHHVDGAVGAVEMAHRLQLDCLVFNNRGDQETLAAMERSNQLAQKVIVWDQNGPTEDAADKIFACDAVKRLLCVSASQCDGVRHHPVFSKTEFIYNSVEPSFFSGAEARLPNSVVFLGSLVPAKGFQLLAAAWPAIRRAVPTATLHVLGSAQLYNDSASLGPLGVAEAEFELQMLVPHLGATRAECQANGVNFHGLASPQQVRDQLLRAAVAVVNPHCHGPSSETFCVSAVEAQACATAVVGGRAGGLVETVRHGQTGVLISDLAELPTELIGFLRNPRKAAVYGERGRRYVDQRFAPGAMGDRWVQVLSDVVNDRPAHPPSIDLKRVTASLLARESLRVGRSLPLIGRGVPTLRQLRKLRSRILRPHS